MKNKVIIRPMSQGELKAIKNMGVKQRVKKWKTFLKCCQGCNVLPTRKQVKEFSAQRGPVWEYYQEQIS